jgi:PIN domain nuclease of toxin-antitoxin system
MVSVVTIWEMVIKYKKGRLDLPDPPEELVHVIMRDDGLQALSVDMNHSLQVASLPPFHNDPFDRLLIAQAQFERLPILTADVNIARYDVEIIW